MQKRSEVLARNLAVLRPRFVESLYNRSLGILIHKPNLVVSTTLRRDGSILATEISYVLRRKSPGFGETSIRVRLVVV